MKVTAKTKDKDKKELPPVTVEVDIPEGLEALGKKFGQDVVSTAARAQIVITAQAFMRRLIEKGKKAEEVQVEMDKWKPDVRSVVKMSAFERATSQLDKLSPDEKAKLLKGLQDALKADKK